MRNAYAAHALVYLVRVQRINILALRGRESGIFFDQRRHTKRELPRYGEETREDQLPGRGESGRPAGWLALRAV